MKNKNIIAAITSGLAFTLVLLAITLSFVMSELNMKKQELHNVYENEFYTFCDSVNNLESDLAKLTVARNSVDSIAIINDTHTHAQSAIDAFSVLPLDFSNEQTCLKFLNQVCDWSNSYAVAVAKRSDANYTEGAEKLYACAKQLNQKLKEIANKAHGNKLAHLSGNALLSQGAVDLNLSIRSLNIEYPTLIYDGPFSDKEEFVAKALENKRNIKKDEAVRIAEDLLGMRDVKVLGTSEGKVRSFELSGNVDGNEAYASITEKGGYVSLFLCNFNAEDGIGISHDSAEKLGRAKLESMGYSDMKAVWKNEKDNELYINFAPYIDGVIYYPDLVKVRINTKCSKVEGVEATGFVSSFTKRNYKVGISKEQALDNVSLDKVISVRLAVIPSGKDERFCYEVYGTHNGEKYYIYVDAMTDEQVDVLKVIGSDQGEVVM